MMRRAHLNEYPDQRNTNGYGYQNNFVEEDNERKEEELKHKVKALKSLTIDIGNEVREQNKYINEMHDDFDKGGSLLDATVNRLKKITQSGGHKHICYLLGFALFVFFLIWVIVKFR